MQEKPHTQSIRISADLYDFVRQQAATMQRSISQQLEFLARLGSAVETSPLISGQQLRQIAESFGTPPDDTYDTAFSELIGMNGNARLQQRLAATSRQLVGRDEETGDLVHVDPKDLAGARRRK